MQYKINLSFTAICLLFSSILFAQKNKLTSIGEAEGDLNKDGIPEKVVVYNTSRQTDFGTERELHIFRKQNDKWILWDKAIGVIMSSESGGVMGDPFAEISIQNGAIVINQAGGSRQKWSYIHRFRFQNNKWQLIGVQNTSGAPCEGWDDFDYNLSTGTIVYKNEVEKCNDNGDFISSQKTQKKYSKKLPQLPDLSNFKAGETEVKLSDGKTFYF